MRQSCRPGSSFRLWLCRYVKCMVLMYDDFDSFQPYDDWCFTATFVHMVGFKGNEAKSKMKHPSGMPTPTFELRW